MNKLSIKKYTHICPRNCPSACSMISHIENNRLVHLTGDPRDAYTKGKLCAKGFSFLEKNSHAERLKFPYYQEVKGTGRLTQITWEKAFELILQKIVEIYAQYNDFLPLAYYKGTGNIGIHHFVSEHFFASLGSTTKLVGPAELTKLDAIKYDTGAVKMSDPTIIREAGMIIIWGANPAATNIHLIPFIIEAKAKGAKIIVIDPLYTQTAELADLFIQLRPSMDGVLANLFIKRLLQENAIDQTFVEQHTIGFEKYWEYLHDLDEEECLKKCDVPQEAIDLLLNWLKRDYVASHLIGSGLSKHINGGQSVRAIHALAAIRGDIGKLGGGIFFKRKEERIFNNQNAEKAALKNRVIHLNELNSATHTLQNQPPIEMMWISCANPLTQSPNVQTMKQFIDQIPFVVTVDHFLTPTAKMSNLILPTTTHFEEMDIVISSWHKKIALNEQAIPPFYQSKSEWNIMTELAKRLNDYTENICSFPVHASEEEYLNAQFNEDVDKRYFVKNISDLRKKTYAPTTYGSVWEKREFATESKRYQFYSREAQELGFPPLPIFVDGKLPTDEHPFWLITPHHPYAFNSQFHFLHLADEREAHVVMSPNIASNLGVFEGEVVKVYNEQGSIELKVLLNNQIPRDIVVIYNGWYANSDVNVNKLVPMEQTDMGENSRTKGYAFFDTFVNIKKL